MLYQTVFTLTADSVHYPDGTGQGFDRLSFSFPYEGRDQLVKDLIDQGKMDRYFGPHDSVTHVDNTIVVKGPTWKNLADAQMWEGFIGLKVGVISTEIVEITE